MDDLHLCGALVLQYAIQHHPFFACGYYLVGIVARANGYFENVLLLDFLSGGTEREQQQTTEQ